jgi:hypothetical protein
VSPTGQILSDDLNLADSEWSPDGSKLARMAQGHLTVFRADGSLLGSFPASESQGLRWTDDSSSILAPTDSGESRVVRIDTQGKRHPVAGLFRFADGGPGGAIVGGYDADRSDGFTSPGVGLFDDGKTTLLARSGDSASWSLGGDHVAVLDRPVWRPGDPEVPRAWSALIYDPSGDLERRVSPTGGMSIAGGSDQSGTYWNGPQWIGDRYLVFAVAPVGHDVSYEAFPGDSLPTSG